MTNERTFPRMPRPREATIPLLLFCLPALVLIFVFNYVPMYGILMAFENFVPSKGIMGSAWVGWRYFERFIHSYQFSALFINTLGLSLYLMLATFPLPIILAITFNRLRNRRVRGFIQTVSFAPHFISVVVVVSMMSIFLSPTSGIVNLLVHAAGGDAVNYMAEPSWFKSLYVLSDIWQHTGWDSLIYFAALSAIDPELYDAASVDGAGAWRQVRHVELPALAPTIVVLLVLRAGSIINVGFEKTYLMQNVLNLSSSEVIATYVYKVGLQSLQYSYSAAIGVFTNVISFGLLAAVNGVAKKFGGASLW
jgi:putative aldouronate transport system permease protein